MTLQPQGAILPTFEELQMSCMRFIFSSFFYNNPTPLRKLLQI